MLALIQPPADDLLAKAEKLKAELEGSKTSAQARVPNKEELALGLLHGVYGVVDLAEECAARGAKHSRYVPTKFCVQGEGKGTVTVGTSYSFTFEFRPEHTTAVSDSLSLARSDCVVLLVLSLYLSNR
jgi:hypothetical protein